MDLCEKPIVAAAHGQRPSRYPVWFLRQAGRYLPEYQDIRRDLDFLALCRNPEQAALVTLQPLARFDLDAAILFSDILIPCVHMGQNLRFDRGHGPILTPPVRTVADVEQLRQPDVPTEMAYVAETLAKVSAKLKPAQAMIGFAGAPFTVASYMIEGRSSQTYAAVKAMLLQTPKAFTSLLAKISAVIADSLRLQVAAGADVVMLFDSWAGHLSMDDYGRWVLPPLVKLLTELQELGVPVVYYPGQGASHLSQLQALPCQVLAVDWRVSLPHAADLIGPHPHIKALQGNLDPAVLSWAPEELVRSQVQRVVQEAQPLAWQHIFNVGHGLLPTTNIAAVHWAIEELRRTPLAS